MTIDKTYLRILVLDDHELLAYGLKAHLQTLLPGVQCDIFTSGKDACNASLSVDYDLYIVDLELEDMSGFEVIEKIRFGNAKAKILVCTMHEEIWFVKKLNACRINGILLKSSSREELSTALEEMAGGSFFYCKRFAYLKKSNPELENERNDKSLSVIDYQLLVMIGKGYTSREIAEKMKWSVKTVESYRKRLFDYFDVSNVASLVAFAMK